MNEIKPIEEMTLAEMEARRDQLETDIATLKAKLEQVRAKRVQTGEYADPDWYRRAKTRLRFTAIEFNKLQRRIAEVRRVERQAQAARVERAFVDHARRTLDEVTFQRILDAAQAEVKP